MGNPQEKQHTLSILSGTTVLLLFVTGTQLTISARMNAEISGNFDPCNSDLPVASQGAISPLSLASAVLFTVNTFPANVFRLHSEVQGLIEGVSASRQELYFLSRYLKNHLDETVMIVVADDQGKKIVEDHLKKQDIANYTMESISNFVDGTAVIPIGLTRQNKRHITRIISTKTLGDSVAAGLMLMPLATTTLLSLLYSFHAYHALGGVWGEVGYLVASVAAIAKVCFRLDSTAAAAVLLKDQLFENALKGLLYQVLPIISISAMALPYGLYQQQLLNGAIDWMVQQLQFEEACQLAQARPFITAIGCLVFGLGAKPSMTRWFQEGRSHMAAILAKIAWLMIPFFLAGFADVGFSAVYFGALIVANQPAFSDIISGIIAGVYTLPYTIYYMLGNLEEVANVVQTVRESRSAKSLLHCGQFKTKKQAEDKPLLPNGHSINAAPGDVDVMRVKNPYRNKPRRSCCTIS